VAVYFCLADEEGQKVDDLVTLSVSKRLQQIDGARQVQGIDDDGQSFQQSC